MPRRLAMLLVVSAPALIPTGVLVQQAASATTNTIVSLTFDDGSASQYSTLPMLQSRGMLGTYYINSAMVGSSSYYMIWSQIHELANAGNEIGGHTLHHTNLTKVDTTTATHEVCDDRQSLLAQGFWPVASFAYPEAANNATVDQIVSDCGYASGRDVGNINSGSVCSDCPYAETIPPRDAFALRTPEPAVSTTTLADLQSYVTGAETHGGGWLIIVFHGICDNSCTSTNSLMPSIFTAFLDWLQPRSASGTVVQTVAQVMGQGGASGNPFTTINCNGAACSGGWYRATPVTVSLTATEPGGTIAQTRYTTDGTDPTNSATAFTYTGPFGVGQTTTVRYYSTDTNGVAESPKSKLIQIDAAAPTVQLTKPPAGSSYRRGVQVLLSADATDLGTGIGSPSGIANVDFFDGTTKLGSDNTAPYEFSWTTPKAAKAAGDHSLTAVATDIAGNQTKSSAVVVTVIR